MIKCFDIKNKRVLDILNRYSEFVMNYDMEQTTKLMSKDAAEIWVTDSYRDAIISQGESHQGTPASAKSYPIKPWMHRNLKDNYRETFNDFAEELKLELGVEVDALSQKYPPGGYIAWHNNANASGYNLIFTWSETGDGWFKYVNESGETVTLHDKKGWSLKAGYFADYNEDIPPCYHAAYTNCWRITQSFVVSLDKDFWEDCIEYISNDLE